MLNKIIWRIRYSVHGQSKCPIGIKIWWGWSLTSISELGVNSSPLDAAKEEVYQLAADC